MIGVDPGPLNVPWWELSDKQAAFAVIALEDQYSRDYAWRRKRARRLGGMYHGRNFDTPFMEDARFTFRVDSGEMDEIPLTRNKCYEYVETHVSKIGASDAPRSALMITDGDYELKRKVTIASRLLEAEYDMAQGQFPNIHALSHQGLRLAVAATGTVAAKIYPWPEEDRVVVELHDTLDMFLDDTELTYGYPRTYGEVTWWPAHRLKNSYPGYAAAIDQAIESRKDRGGLTFTGRTGRAELVPIWEAWAIRVGESMGRHIVCLRDGTVLNPGDQDWDETEPPFAFFHASPALAGFWATPPMEVVYEEILKVNEIIYRCDEAHTDNAQQVHYVCPNDLLNINELTDIDTIKVVQMKSGAATQRVYVENPAPFNRMDFDLLQNHEDAIARTLGVSEMASAAKAQPGLPSGVAQREAAARYDNRHASTHRAFVQWVAVDIGRHVLKAQRKLYEQNTAFKRKWTGEFFTKEIEAKDIIDLDLEALHVQVKPVGELKNTPEERVQYAQELVDRGAIPFESFISALQTYDVPGETKVIKTQRRWVAWQIDRWLMSKPEQLAEPNFYQGPRPWMRKPDAMVQVVDSLMEAEISEVPHDRIQYFLDFIAELAQQMSAEVQPPAAPQAPLGMGAPAQGSAGMNVGLGGSTGGVMTQGPAPAMGPGPVV